MFERFTGRARRVMVHEGAGLAAPGAGVAEEPGRAWFCPAGPARGSHVFGR